MVTRLDIGGERPKGHVQYLGCGLTRVLQLRVLILGGGGEDRYHVVLDLSQHVRTSRRKADLEDGDRLNYSRGDHVLDRLDQRVLIEGAKGANVGPYVVGDGARGDRVIPSRLVSF